MFETISFLFENKFRLIFCQIYRVCVIFLGNGPPSAELLANLTSSCEPPSKMPRLSESQSNTNASPVSFDAPKRTRFTFRPEHLDV